MTKTNRLFQRMVLRDLVPAVNHCLLPMPLAPSMFFLLTLRLPYSIITLLLTMLRIIRT